MRKWFVAPYTGNEYETFAARILHYTLLLLLCLALFTLNFLSLPVQFVLVSLFVIILTSCYVLLHTGRLHLASFLFLCGLWFVITVSAFNLNELRDLTLSSYTIVIIFTTILLTERTVVIFTGLSILSTLLLAIGEVQGILPVNRVMLPAMLYFLQQIAPFSAAGILLYATSRVIRLSFQRVRDNEQTLLERNRQLEAEIAERQRSESNMRISETKYRLLFENIPVMAAVYDKDGTIVLVNNLGAKVMGGTPETLQGRNMLDVFSSPGGEISFKNQAQVMQDGKPMLIEARSLPPGGQEIWLLRHIMPIPSPDNEEFNQVLVLTTNLTEKYIAEQREQDLALAHEKNVFLTEFFSTISHDLKTPLATINTSIYLLQRAQTDEQRSAKIARISEQIALMDKYIQEMLTISRLEHLPTLNLVLLDLNPLVDAVIDLLRPSMEGKGLDYQLSKQPDLPLIQGDAEQLHRMLMNLIENAVNYTPTGGQIKITTALRAGQVIFEVVDSGIGIAPEAAPHIFERFFRAANAKEAANSGTGLGLAIVKKIVEMHTATIEVQSQVGKGTTFYVSFPVPAPSGDASNG